MPHANCVVADQWPLRRAAERFHGSCYRSRLWRDTQVTHKRTRPYRPQTERRDALPAWLHTYDHHRGHTALAGQPRPNLTGQYTQTAGAMGGNAPMRREGAAAPGRSLVR